MGTAATLEPSRSVLEAGTDATVTLSLRNDSDIVEEYSIRVVGDPSDWARVEPPEVTVYPGQSATVVVSLEPPRSSTVLAGEHPYGVHVQPAKHPENAAVPEGVVELRPFYETVAELSPQTAKGKGPERYRVSVANRGNAAVAVALAGKSASDALALILGESRRTVEPGTTWTSELRAEPTERLWRGTPTALPFTVMVMPEEGPETALAGTQYQEPLLPSWLFKALLALLVLAALLVAAVLWGWPDGPGTPGNPDTPRPSMSASTAGKPTPTPTPEEPTPTPTPEEPTPTPTTEEPTPTPTPEEATPTPTPTPEETTTVVVSDKPVELMTPLGGEPRDEAFEFISSQGGVLDTSAGDITITDLVLSTPEADAGSVRLLVDEDEVHTFRLESVINDRDVIRAAEEADPLGGTTIDEFSVPAGRALRLELTCDPITPPADPGADPGECSVTAEAEGTLTSTATGGSPL